MFNNISSSEIMVVALVFLLLFGGKKLPEFARGLGESAKELKKAKREFNKSMKDVKED